jgi:hypothetical protein
MNNELKIKSKQKDVTDLIVVDSFSYLLTFKTKLEHEREFDSIIISQ